MNSVRLAIAGASGRMGRVLLEAASLTPGVTLGAALDIAASPFAGHDAGEICIAATGVKIETDVAAALARADVLIDFTRPEGTLAHVKACRAAKRAIVIGTTGFSAGGLDEIRAASNDIAIMMAPNMSIGMLVMAKLVEMASRVLGPDYDAEVFEIHHSKKVDAPSGTALMLGKVVAKARGENFDDGAVFARHGNTGERKPGTVGFASLRAGDVVGDHTVYFGGAGERIEVTHRSTSRATYAQGAMRAARFIATQKPGLYDMDDVLGLR
ncbi:MAG: 4-hydroxy-tetrahydrodipicolinate reductase [Usitatibacter sp.]